MFIDTVCHSQRVSPVSDSEGDCHVICDAMLFAK